MKKDLTRYVRKTDSFFDTKADVYIALNNGDLFIGVSVPRCNAIVYIVYRSKEIENIIECKKYKLNGLTTELYFIETSDIEIVRTVIRDRVVESKPHARDEDGFIILRRAYRGSTRHKMVSVSINIPGSDIDNSELARCIVADIMLDIPCDVRWDRYRPNIGLNPIAIDIGDALMGIIPRPDLTDEEVWCISSALSDFSRSIVTQSPLKRPKIYNDNPFWDM